MNLNHPNELPELLLLILHDIYVDHVQKPIFFVLLKMDNKFYLYPKIDYHLEWNHN